MILSCVNINKTFIDVPILTDCSFHVEANEKAAIVGVNGAGKSTLLKIIMKELSADSGDVVISKDKTIGYLAQYQDLGSELTIYDEILTVKEDVIKLEERIRETEFLMKSATGDELTSLMDSYAKMNHEFEFKNGYSYKSEVTGVLKGLGFSESDFNKHVSTLSGGQKTRVSLGKLLLSKPDIILLDEPTNHLDLNSISWLENFLSSYKGTVIIVCHDRYFLDKVVTKVIEIENCKVTTYLGNYSDYAAKKEMLREAQIKLYYKQQQEIKHQQEVIDKLRSFKQEKFYKRAESREKSLEKTELVDKPEELNTKIRLNLDPEYISGNDVLSVSDLSVSFENKTLFDNVNFEIKRGEHVALIGDNGTGKSTILKIITGFLDTYQGVCDFGAKVSIGYYDQEHHTLDESKTLFDEISDTYPEMSNTKIRNTLAAFLFTGDDVFKLIGDLSGGEKGRLSLAKLMLSKANFLILDEPTNHLDMISKEILENAINNYSGTVLYVSHDRYFINKTCTRILELSNNTILNYIGNYDYYLEKRDLINGLVSNQNTQTDVSKSTDSKNDWLSNKQEQARLRKLKTELEKTEFKIDELETEKSEVEEQLSDPANGNNVSKLMELQKSLEKVTRELDDLYVRWEELSEELN